MGDEAATRLKRTKTWAGLRAGDPVEVDDARAKRGSFEFVALVENLASGESWVEVVGGKKGDRKLWSFRPEQIFAPGSRKKGQSLDVEPQLPLI